MDSRLEQWILRLLAAQRFTFTSLLTSSLACPDCDRPRRKPLAPVDPGRSICITMKRVMMEPIVTARPVKPLKKKA